MKYRTQDQITEKYFIILAKTTKCYCGTKMGKGANNYLICEDEDNGFKRTGNCSADEWCVGPIKEKDATESIDRLCAKGTVNGADRN